jgi:hypothetical protein
MDVTLSWRKATASASNGGGCVEVASDGQCAYVRDTTARERGHLVVTADAWRVFVSQVTNNDR